MFNSRLSEIVQKANAPFTSASSSHGDFIVANSKAAFNITAGAREGEIDTALKAITEEAERIKRYGFTASEYERARANYLTRLENTYKEREKLNNSFFVRNILNHFLTSEALPGIEMEYTMMQQIAPAIAIEQINTYAMSLPTEDNVVIAVMMPEKAGLEKPTPEALLSVFKAARGKELEAYQETLSDEPLVPHTPVAGRVVTEVPEPMSGGTVWNLSNGATVVLKKTDFKEDQILFSAVSRGGYSHFDIADVISSKVINDVISIGGAGNFSATDLRKVLAGKIASLRMTVGSSSENATGSTSPRDIETFMQLLHINFTSLRKDQEAFQAYISRLEAQLKNMSAEPMMAYSDTIQKTLYNNHPFATRLNMDMLQKIDYDRSLELAKERFSNAADFTFIFVGNFDPASLKPLVEKYIGSLPGNKGRKEDWKDLRMNPITGKVQKHFDREMQTPKATAYTIYTGKVAYNVENNIMASITSQIFDMVFTRTIREEEQGTYGVGVNMSMSYYPDDNFTFLFGFDTDVALKERLLARAYKEIDNVIANGVEADDFAKAVEYMTKTYEQNLRENSYWLGTLSSRFLIGKDMHTTYQTALRSVTPQKLNNFIRDIFSQGNQLEVVMKGYAPSAK